MTEIRSSPQTALAEIFDAVAEARRAVAEGAQIQLAGLDDAVTRVCDAGRELPPAERGAHAERLKELAQALDLLAKDLARQDAAGLRQQAQSAYGGGKDVA
jgi:hypothetical protein